MSGEEEGKDSAGGGHRRTYSRSVSWTDRAPASRKPHNKPRSLLASLQPLSINKNSVQEWPSAGSDDLGVWPLPQTPKGSIRSTELGSMNEFQFKRDKLAFYDKECSRIADHVYLGSDTVAKNHELLRQNGITHVLNCVGFVCPEYFKSDFVYKTLWLKDSPTEDITSILYDVFDYFEDVREQRGRVLVHCCRGVSRSTSLVIAYIMWREGQSFEDAFQYVKNARGVTNPNMGFASQLLQCQKRVHAMPASPKSILRMYRMAPHSPYDPLHLVPKMVNQPCAQALDSRGAFIIHVPSAVYVWTGKNCNCVMSCNAKSAADQVIRYERARGPVLMIHEDEEPPDFWIALSNEQLLSGNCDKAEVKQDTTLASSARMEIDDGVHNWIRPRKVDEYDLDFEIFHKALAGGVVPPFSVSNDESETCLPTRENSWGRLRRKLASGLMKGLFPSCKNTNSSKAESGLIMEEEKQHSLVDPSSPSSNHPCGSPDSFECFPDNSSDRAKDTLEVMDHFVPSVDSSLPPSPGGMSDSYAFFLSNSRKLSSKSPTFSPSSSDYASSFTFSPSSTNWSSRLPSPSSLESTEAFYGKDASLVDGFFSLQKEAVSSPSEAYSANHSLGRADFYLRSKGSSPSIAERRGSNLPPHMVLPSVNESPRDHKALVRSQSFSLPDLNDNLNKDVSSNLRTM
ncbi:hypothetical protein TanjilG_19872 [Lupinus angustifolius]|uniref:Protein-tyrosine-phosphatase MKP1 n=1 Tax=Lupinus angustifolius TaxID=3871 RepID=A0A1J7HYG0_LUPAN|nr:PREDICTED: protein-tyrosine-phosphatase MKP1-like [Lupinus angustifolius]OIW17903.1 hypothetical protein TanjilG_19872 [Lupinus angustifolius]